MLSWLTIQSLLVLKVMSDLPFWKTKTLEEMNEQEWESLCDNCGLCCLIQLEDEDTGQIVRTNVACKYLDMDSCTCSDYENRQKNVPDCLKVTPEIIPKLEWMPPSCAYLLLHQGKDLYDWHPLISGRAESVHEAGTASLHGRMICESEIDMDNIEDYVNDSE